MRRPMRVSSLALALLLAGCPKRDAPVSSSGGGDADLADAAAQEAAAAAAAASADASADASNRTELALALPWTEAIRAQQWKEAEDGIAALSAGEQKKPEVRFARARVALALGKHADAVSRLEKLEDELPLLRDAIGKVRAQAALVAGPYDRAAEWYGSRPTPASWVTAAEAWEKGGELAKARTLVDRALAVDKKSRANEEKARTLRMRVVRKKDGDSAAVADARWLAINALDDATASAANEVLEKEQRPVPLTADELIARAKVLADAGRSDEALRAVERAGNAAGKPASPLDLCHARAEAYFKARTRYPEAALAYRACAALGGPKAGEDSFLSARAFSRADRDGDAMPAFASVIQ
ncbi:MAG: soluble lytic murein transglycosylase, partial [Myxococcales bacterium]|nr:soluble lytic murein transglycosylase [Myxococcales bacterium]